MALFRRRPHERAGFLLYGAAVTAARDPLYFKAFGVPDTLDGRFELIGLQVALLVRRLRHDADPRGAELAQAVFDAMFADMDATLRESGLDMSVGRRVKTMWEGWHGRARAYEAALDADDRAALAAALERNVFARDDAAGAHGAAMLDTVAATVATLAPQPIAALLLGQVHFPAPHAVPAHA